MATAFLRSALILRDVRCSSGPLLQNGCRAALSSSARPDGENTEASSSVSTKPEEDAWTEVVHDQSGQVYFWNQVGGHAATRSFLPARADLSPSYAGPLVAPSQRTGETTQLGEPKPSGGRSGGHQGASGGASSGSSSHGSGAYVDPRSESFLPDRTGYYAGMGALAGAVLGWSSQFF